MSWQNKKHITRIFNVFKRNKDRIYPEDIESLKALDEIITNSSKEFVHGNLVYAKLLALYLRQNIYYHKDIKLSIKKLQMDLKMPLDAHLGLLERELNQVGIHNYLEKNGIEHYTHTRIKEEFVKDNKEFVDILLNNWSPEIVEKSFYNTANDLLKEIENYT